MVIKNTLLSLLFVLSLTAVMTSAYTYRMDYYDYGTAGSTSTSNPVTFDSNEISEASIIFYGRAFLDSNESSVTYTVNLYSPYNSHIASLSGSSAPGACINIGSYEDDLDSISGIEHRNIMTTSGNASSQIYDYVHIIANTSERYFTITTHDPDTEGYTNNMYSFKKGCDPYSFPSVAVFSSYFSSPTHFYPCTTGWSPRREQKSKTYSACGGGNYQAIYQYVPFNSSAGNVTYTVSTTNPAQCYLYDITNPAGTTVITCGSGELNLESYKIYVLGVAESLITTGNYHNKANVTLNIDVGFSEWDCSEWGSCTDSIQSRTCTDINGLNPPKIETISCDLTILQNATLGFEDYENVENIAKCSPTWLLGCGFTNENITVERPTGWTELSPEFKSNFYRMTSEWSTEGTRSLRMWTIPPMEGVPIDYTANCYNTTSAELEYINRSISNTSILSSFNVTFPATNMHISLDARDCVYNELHNDALTTVFGIELCPKKYYASNGSQSPLSDFTFNIIDSTGSSIFGSAQFFNAPSVYWKEETVGAYTVTLPYAQAVTYEMDLTGLGIIPGEDYNIIISPQPDSLFSSRGNCVLIDNIRYHVTSESFETLTGCESGCVGSDYYTAYRNNEGRCVTTKTENAPDCIDNPDLADAMSNFEDYCDGNDLYTFSQSIGKYNIIEDSDYCTTINEETEIDTELYEVTNNDMNLSIIYFLLSPFTIITAIIILLGAGVFRLTKSKEISLIAMLMIMIGLSLANLYSWLITGTIIGVIIILTSVTLVRKASGD